MNNTSINIEGKLPQGLVALYADVSNHAQALGINYLVVGAMARDLVLVHGFNATIERGTKDVDLLFTERVRYLWLAGKGLNST